jgi:hypothetical protein
MATLKTMVIKDKDGKDITVGILDSNFNPIYEIDGKEIGQDLSILRSDLARAMGESAERRLKLKEAEEKILAFKGIDPDKARSAMSVVDNLDDKKLMDAKQVEVMKAQWEESFKANKAQTDASYEAKIKELEGLVENKENSIKRMLIKGAFDTSQFLEQTIYGPLRDSAFKMFGENFEVEPGDNGDYRVVAKMGGKPIISVSRPGQPATPDEALEEIINSHPQRQHILKGSQASSGGATGGGGGGGSKTTLQQLQERYDTAVKNNDFNSQVALKKQIHMERQGQQ